MSDLIQQLKHQSKMFAMSDSVALSKLWTSAADEIERLTAELSMVNECSDRNDRNNFDIIADCSKRTEKLTAERDELIKNQAKRDLKMKIEAINNLISEYSSGVECVTGVTVGVIRLYVAERVISELTKQAECE